MYKFGPYGTSHATAATLAFRKKLLNITSFNDIQCVAEEKHFLKNYTIPFVQLDTMKTILVFSHVHNSFDKKVLLQNGDSPYVKIVNTLVEDFVKEPEIFQFFMKDIDDILQKYEPGKPDNKPDVLKQMEDLKLEREKKMIDYQHWLNNSFTKEMENKINQMNVFIQ
jgi:hypothetical protein